MFVVVVGGARLRRAAGAGEELLVPGGVMRGVKTGADGPLPYLGSDLGGEIGSPEL